MAKASKKVARKQENFLQRYFRETTGELRKVTWPTRQEALNLTLIVLVVIVAMGAFFGILDFIYSQFFLFILGV